jgi:hypothetical protein
MPKKITKEEKETFFFNPYEEEGVKEFRFPEVDKETLDWIKMKKSGTSKKTKETEEQKKYKELMENPKISTKSKASLKRNTSNGTNLNMKDLLSFEQVEKLMYESDSEDDDKPINKKEYNEINELQDKIKIIDEKLKKEKSITKQNKLMNERETLIVKVKTIEAQPVIKKLIKKLDKALENGEITKKEYKEMKEGTIKSLGTDHLRIKRLQIEKDNNQKKYYDRIMKINMDLQNYTGSNPKNFNQSLYNEINRLKSEYKIDEAEKKLKELIKQPKKVKQYKVGNIMKGRSDLKKKGDKYTVDTEINVKKGLEPKIKRALKKSVNEELDRKFKGGSIILDYDDSSSDDEEYIKPVKNIDKNELNNYSKILYHLLEHIKVGAIINLLDMNEHYN